MSLLPRIALGTLTSATDPSLIAWALIDILKRRNWQIQLFHDRACLHSDKDTQAACGHNPRYLDSWLMSPELCQESFAFEMSDSNFAIVLGNFAAARPASPLIGGTLEDLWNWLNLPALAVVDVSQLGQCQLPPPLPGIAGVLLDRVPAEKGAHWQTVLESLWGLPVLGILPELPKLRATLANANLAHSERDFCSQLGDELGKTLQFNRLMRLATKHDFIAPTPRVFTASSDLAGMRIAVAYDEAINGYFPATLDLLELHGAEVCDFSPLHDETLPPDCDLVYVGCGRPQNFATQLAKNHCMTFALQNHVRLGGKLFAECGGLAYLCQSMVVSSGESIAMSGVLPAIAVERSAVSSPIPTELTLTHGQWLGRPGTKLRGYLNTSWQIEPTRPLTNCAAETNNEFCLAAYRQAVGSRLHIDFAAQPNLLQRFSNVAAQAITR